MALRYSGKEPDTMNLTLTDCPQPSTNAFSMAYRSQLVQWHYQYPPTLQEQIRNDHVCQDWQGNRNPFVDFPELATVFFGEAAQITVQPSQQYQDLCLEENTTMAPTATPNACDFLQPGDLYITLVNTQQPQNIAISTLIDLLPYTTLLLTDNAWNGIDFQNTEGTYQVRTLFYHA